MNISKKMLGLVGALSLLASVPTFAQVAAPKIEHQGVEVLYGVSEQLGTLNTRTLILSIRRPV